MPQPNGPGPDAGHGSRHLAPAEVDVLRASATGMTTAEVAAHLGVTTDAVRGHLARAMAALGARSKLEAVLIALRRGLIDRAEA